MTPEQERRRRIQSRLSGLPWLKPPPKSLSVRTAEADERGSHWLAEANQAAERGQHEKAEKLYAKGQFWLDRSNKLRGDA